MEALLTMETAYGAAAFEFTMLILPPLALPKPLAVILPLTEFPTKLPTVKVSPAARELCFRMIVPPETPAAALAPEFAETGAFSCSAPEAVLVLVTEIEPPAPVPAPSAFNGTAALPCTVEPVKFKVAPFPLVPGSACNPLVSVKPAPVLSEMLPAFPAPAPFALNWKFPAPGAIVILTLPTLVTETLPPLPFPTAEACKLAAPPVLVTDEPRKNMLPPEPLPLAFALAFMAVTPPATVTVPFRVSARLVASRVMEPPFPAAAAAEVGATLMSVMALTVMPPLEPPKPNALMLTEPPLPALAPPAAVIVPLI